jgi:malate permease and related proteins
MLTQFAALVFLIALGAGARRFHDVHPHTLSTITTEIFFPPFIFLSIVDAEMKAADMLHPALGATVVILGGIAVVGITGRVIGKKLLPYALPIAFMNSGFMGIPIADSIGGQEWVNRALIFDQMMSIWIFTAGLWALGIGASLKERARLVLVNPCLIAIALSFGWRFFELPVPELLRAVLYLPAQAAIPIALFSIGAFLAEMKPAGYKAIAFGTLARYAIGAGIALLYNATARPDATTAGVILVSATTPSAVFSFLLSERYRVNADYAAGVVLATTVLYPLVFLVVGYWSRI